MKLSDYFERVTCGEWNNTSAQGSWKIEDKVMYFECSNGREDWQKNFDALPALIFIRGVPIITQRGWARVWKDLKPIVDAHPEVEKFVGYSHGSTPTTFGAWHTGKPGICFGSPNIAFITGAIRRTFAKVWYIVTYNDIVDKAPPWLGKHGTQTVLPYVEMPEYEDIKEIARWKTGHAEENYILGIKRLEEGI